MDWLYSEIKHSYFWILFLNKKKAASLFYLILFVLIDIKPVRRINRQNKRTNCYSTR